MVSARMRYLTVSILSLFLVEKSAAMSDVATKEQNADSLRLVHAGINIPPPPKNAEGEFFFDSSNAVSFSDAYFDYSQFKKEKLKELFGAVSSEEDRIAFGFNSARIQVNTKTLLKRFYLDDFVTARTKDNASQMSHDKSFQEASPLELLLSSVFLDTTFLDLDKFDSTIPSYLIEEATDRKYVTPLQTVEYIASYTNYGNRSGPRRAIFNFCGTCTNCTDKVIPPPNYDNHGSGKLDSCTDYTQGFDNLIAYFSAERFRKDELHFELFNEPHLSDIHDPYFRNCLMEVAKKIDQTFGKGRVIWPAASWESNAGVTYDYEMDSTNKFPPYDIGWHIYPWCTVPGNSSAVCTVKQHEEWVMSEQVVPWRSGQASRAENKLSQQVWLTEFGASLDRVGYDYFDPESQTVPPSSNVNDLRGIANVIGGHWGAKCSMLRGVFWWHGGYFFEDSYTIGKPGQTLAGKSGAAFIASFMNSVNSEDCLGCTNYGKGHGDQCEVDKCTKCRVAVNPVSDIKANLDMTTQNTQEENNAVIVV